MIYQVGGGFSIVVYAIMLVDIGEGFWCSLLRLVRNQSTHITNPFDIHVSTQHVFEMRP